MLFNFLLNYLLTLGLLLLISFNVVFLLATLNMFFMIAEAAAPGDVL